MTIATSQRAWLARGLALAAGIIAVAAFAPFNWTTATPAALAVLFLLWQHAATPRHAAGIGFAFGVGLFSAGTSWVYIALENFGGMPTPIAMLATAGFITLLSLWLALGGWMIARTIAVGSSWRLLAAAAMWPVIEWTRGHSFTNFPWLAVGYAELLPDRVLPLAGFATIGGVFLVSLAVAACAAAAALIVDALSGGRSRTAIIGAAAIVMIVGTGALLSRMEWTTVIGAPVAITLVQGNVSVEQKFDPAFRATNFQRYIDLVTVSRGRIVVLPESTFPQFADEIPGDVFQRLTDIMRARDGHVLVGLFIAEPPLTSGGDERIHNSVVSLGVTPPQLYQKQHLVPFGETIPLKPLVGWFINRVLAIPLADQTPGPPDQRPFDVAGQRLAVNICYEDVFGNELIEAARNATLLVNVTNDAWYGHSIAARQHNQISQMRALELGRPMLRATNTGITSAIGHDGRVITELPWFTQGLLELDIVGRAGETPYMRMGDAFVLVLAFALLLLAIGTSRVMAARRPVPPPAA
ncbi:MAG: apolipoprotein N-acyltransferase [Betaproteobacteria bacterium]